MNIANIADIEPWLAVMQAGAIDELRLAQGDTVLQLRRHADSRCAAAEVAPVAASTTAVANVVPSATTPKAETAPASPPSGAGLALRIVEAPMVGTVYLAPSPGAPALAPEGAAVQAGQPLCVIEAMKIMNEVPSDFDGTVMRVLVPNGTLVQAGQPLFEIR